MLSKAGYATLIPVKNMTRAINFYTEKLGAKLTYRGEGEMKNFWASLKLGKEDFWLVNPDEKEKRALAYSVFLVKNIKSQVKELEGKGVKFEPGEAMGEKSKVSGPIVTDPNGASAFFKDSEGNLLMIFQGM